MSVLEVDERWAHVVGRGHVVRSHTPGRVGGQRLLNEVLTGALIDAIPVGLVLVEMLPLRDKRELLGIIDAYLEKNRLVQKAS